MQNVISASESRRIPVPNRIAAVAALLGAAALLALALRLYGLDAQSLWYDEGFSVYLASMEPGEITARTAADIQPPLYYYLLRGWMRLFGDGEVAVRGLSVLFGLLTVPLIYMAGLALFQSKSAGLLAAFLVAISPLHIWYAQEVRMYTLLTFLCLLSSYLLLRVTTTRDARQAAALWAGFTAANVAAIYTHYFAFFVLAFQAVYLLWTWGRERLRPRHLVIGGAASGLVTLLAYLPWLPNLLTRYDTDVSYLEGRLKLGEVLVDIAVLFAGGESVTEADGLLWAAGIGVVLVVCLAALFARASAVARREPQNEPSALPAAYDPILFLLLYLLLPPVLILAISYAAPKFNARYVMMSHPALLLILGGGLAALRHVRGQAIANVLRQAAAILGMLLLFAASAYAVLGAYGDPDFARADFRGVATYLRDHVQEKETIILVSGHAFPVFDYYAPDLDRHLLPDTPTLDTTATLDYSIAGTLNEWLGDKSGVWLVLWQDEVVDPAGYLPSMLAESAQEVPVGVAFSQVDVRHYRLPDGAAFAVRPDIAHPAHVNFGNRLQLLGYTQTGDRQVTLFWEALQPLQEDYRVSIVLRDTIGQSWGQWDGRPTAYYYPTSRWRPGQVVFGRIDLALLPGSPPGDYGLEVGVYTEQDPVGLDVLDAAGNPQGKRAVPGAVRLAVAAATPEEVEVVHAEQLNLGGGIGLIGWDLGREDAAPGDRLLLTPIWSVKSQPGGDYRVRLLLSDAAGQALDAGIHYLTNEWHPTSIWLPGQAWRGQITFRLPIHARPGEASLSLQLLDGLGHPVADPAQITTLQVLSTDRVFAPPAPQALRRANFDNRVGLLGADLLPNPTAPGGTLRVILYWEALAEMDVPYTAFVHLLDANGRVVAGHDGEPAAGARPTTGWVPGEYVTDVHEFAVPADLAPGDYVIEVGVYDAGVPSMPRLPVLGTEGEIATDRIIFTIQVR
ncbi:MAG TPA: glycosyltransferase family 39 protein [Anaerolineae bacterium]|nr:glycosyltransferase family 39 protein [Anaerolineae bacterium]